MTDDRVYPTTVRDTTAADLEWERRAEAAVWDALPNIRAVAGAWSTTITAVTGAVGAVLIIDGPDDIAKLVDGDKQRVAYALLVVGLASAVAILLSALAAQGHPKRMLVTGPELRERHESEAQFAAWMLFVSRLVTVLAVVALTTAIHGLWFGERVSKKPDPQSVLVTFTDGTTTCGPLTASKRGEPAVGRGSSPVNLGSGNVRAVNVVAACP